MAALGQFLRAQMERSPQVPGPAALAFALPLLEHVDEVRPMFAALLGQKGARAVQEQFHETLCQLVEESLPTSSAGAVPRGAAVQFVAASFMALARWWVVDAPGLSVGEMHQLFLGFRFPFPHALAPERDPEPVPSPNSCSWSGPEG